MISENNEPVAQVGLGGPGSGRRPKFKRLRVLPDEEYQRLKQKIARDYNPSLAALTQLSESGQEALASALAGGPNTRQQLQQYHHSLEQAQNLRPWASPTILLPELKSSMVPASAPHTAAPPAGRAAAVGPPEPPPPAVRGAAGAVRGAAGAPPAAVAGHAEENEPEPEEEEEEQFYTAPNIPPKLQRAVTYMPVTYKRMTAVLIQTIADSPEILNVANTNEVVIDGEPVQGSNFYDLIHALYYPPTKTHSLPPHFDKFIEALKRINPPRTALAQHARNQIGMGSGFSIHSSRKTPPGTRSPIRILRVYKDI